ncbi:DUF4870 family protein [Ramlibacter pallidus]|uniref:DUF4870 domain-containing protein n=1 Tax=Ramlibacter pallidus TaxID=2780087 RepID=A0ABR9S1Z2_9BURK|nr:hypothetical protein [Ramlibacter pallidus]MBE7367513.1 hypothetical protein [Ramlibacter pallidus]
MEAGEQARKDALERAWADTHAVNQRQRPELPVGRQPDGSAIRDRMQQENLNIMAHVVYGMYVLPVGLTAIIGLILAHVLKGKAQGSFLQTHFRWQIRTFWLSLALTVVMVGAGIAAMGGFAVTGMQSVGGVVAALVTGIAFWGVLGLIWVWFLYRVIKGWVYLVQVKEIG